MFAIKNQKFINILIVAIGVISAVIFSLKYFHLTNEDAWISFNYARNLADGNGLVINAGDEHQEGYSNLVLVLLMALFKYLFNFDILITSKIIGIVSFISIILFVPLYANRYQYSFNSHEGKKDQKNIFYTMLFFAAVMSISLSQFMARWSSNGLETIMYSLSVVVLVYFTFKSFESNKAAPLVLCAVLSFLSLNIRPEGLVNFPVVLVAYWISGLVSGDLKKDLLKNTLISGVVFVTLLVMLYAWKILYFGDILANPSHVKLALSQWFTVAKKISYITSYFQAKGIYFSIAVLAVFPLMILGMIRSLKNDKKLFKHLMVLSLFIGSQITFVFISGGDYMPFHRFIITHYPLLIFLIILSIASVDYRNSIGKVKYIVFALLCISIVGSAVNENVKSRSWWDQGFISPHDILEKNNHMYYRASVQLNNIMKTERRHYATSEFGYIPYHTKGNGIDMIGLNQKEVAFNYKNYDLKNAIYASRDYVLSKKPATIVVNRYYFNSEKKEIVFNPGVEWFFKPYTESEFFWKYYDTVVPKTPEAAAYEKVFSRWNNTYKSSRAISAGDPSTTSKMLFGFIRDDNSVWAGPISRVLIKPDDKDKYLYIRGYIPDMNLYADNKFKLDVNMNKVAVGDYTYASTVIGEKGKFSFCTLIDDVWFSNDDNLITLKADGIVNSNDKRNLSFIFEGIGFTNDCSVTD